MVVQCVVRIGVRPIDRLGDRDHRRLNVDLVIVRRIVSGRLSRLTARVKEIDVARERVFDDAELIEVVVDDIISAGATPPDEPAVKTEPGTAGDPTILLDGREDGDALVHLAKALLMGGNVLLPVMAIAFLGQTTFTIGRPNVAGVLIAGFFMGVVENALILANVTFYYVPVIQGTILVAAIVLASSGKKRLIQIKFV